MGVLSVRAQDTGCGVIGGLDWVLLMLAVITAAAQVLQCSWGLGCSTAHSCVGLAVGQLCLYVMSMAWWPGIRAGQHTQRMHTAWLVLFVPGSQCHVPLRLPWLFAPRTAPRWQDRGLPECRQAVLQGQAGGQGANLPGASHAEGAWGCFFFTGLWCVVAACALAVPL